MNVLDACAGRDLVLVSSSEAYQMPPDGMFPADETVPCSVPDVTNPRYSYGGGKIASEIAALAYAQAGAVNSAVIVRPHNIYGPDMGVDHVIPQFALRAAALKASGGHDFEIQGTGEATRSFCHIDDCIDGLLIAGVRGENRNVYHLGNPAEEVEIAALAHRVLALLGIAARVVPGELPKGSPMRRVPSIRKLRALGFEPKVPLSRGLAETVAWYAAVEAMA
jgi:dTDP-glucose 4,6-dehydratase/UDP-glucose 4-epimerase